MTVLSKNICKWESSKSWR